MSTARDLVALEEELRDRAVDLFAPIDRSGLLDVPELADVVRRVEVAGYADPLRVIRLCAQALRVQYSDLQPRLIDAELVATLPLGVPGIARPTEAVIREMMRPTAREIILLGYQITDAGIAELVIDAASRGADIVLICDRGKGAAQTLLYDWPTSVKRPRLYVDEEITGGAPYASMHAKCLLVDGADLLVTSANFTFHGLRGNIEIGVRLSGAPAAEARKIFSHLVESGIVATAS